MKNETLISKDRRKFHAIEQTFEAYNEICNGNRPEWNPIRSVIITNDSKIGRPLRELKSDFVGIGRHEVLQSINKKIQFPRKKRRAKL